MTKSLRFLKLVPQNSYSTHLLSYEPIRNNSNFFLSNKRSFYNSRILYYKPLTTILRKNGTIFYPIDTDKEIPLHYSLPLTEFNHSNLKNKLSLIRSYLILNLCRVKLIANNSNSIIKASKFILGTFLTSKLVKWTFFAQFCAGETFEELKNTVNSLASKGIGSISDFASEVEHPDIEESISYNYEKTRDFLNIGIPGKTRYIAIKYSSLFSIEELKKVNNYIIKLNNAFKIIKGIDNLSSNTTHFKNQIFKSRISLHEFLNNGKNIFVEGTNLEFLFNEIISKDDREKSHDIDYTQWCKFFSVTNLHNSSFLKTSKEDLNETDINTFEIHFKYIKDFLSSAQENPDVSILIDAEQTYLQHAIDEITINLQEIYNINRPFIFNTYQAYRKDCSSRLLADSYRAEALGYNFCLKLVRGAYIREEQDLARSIGLDNPINPTIQDTHQQYDDLVKLLLTSTPSLGHLFLGTHNESSIQKATEIVQSGITTIPVHFGQLLGMSDHLTLQLSNNGHQVYKVLPYGPPLEVLPYLIRRVEENGDVLNKLRHDTDHLKKQIFHRFSLF